MIQFHLPGNSAGTLLPNATKEHNISHRFQPKS